MGVTLRDIAKACAVDVSTVSRALRGDERVRPETRERVAATARELGYRPNLAAQHLVTGETRTIWMLLGSITGIQDHQPSQAASRYCQEHGYDLHVVMHHNDPAAYERQLGRLQQHVADGAIVIAGHLALEATQLGALAAGGFPIVFIDRYVPALDMPAFINNNTDACAALLRRCREAGATHACSLFGAGNTAESERAQALASLIGEFGLQPWHEGEPLAADAVLAVLASSANTIHALAERQHAALQGHRLLFACFDAWYGEPSPAEVAFVAEQDFPAMARAASACLLDMIAGKQPQGPLEHVTPLLGIHEVRPRF